MLSSIASVTSFARNNPRLITLAGVALCAAACKLFARYSLSQVYHVKPATTLFDIRDNIRVIDERYQSLLTKNLIYRLVSSVERLLGIRTQESHQQTAKRILCGPDGFGVQIGTISRGNEWWAVKAKPHMSDVTLDAAAGDNTIITLVNAKGERMGDIRISHCYRVNGDAPNVWQSQVKKDSRVTEHYLLVSGMYYGNVNESDAFTLRARIQIIMEIFYRSNLPHLRVYSNNESEIVLAAAGFRNAGTHVVNRKVNADLEKIRNWKSPQFPTDVDYGSSCLEMWRLPAKAFNSETEFFTVDAEKRTCQEVVVQYEHNDFKNSPWEDVIAVKPILSGGNTPVLPEYLS